MLWCRRSTVWTPCFLGLRATSPIGLLPSTFPRGFSKKKTMAFPNLHSRRGIPHRSPAARLLQRDCRLPRPSPARGASPRTRHPPATTFSGAGSPRHARPHLLTAVVHFVHYGSRSPGAPSLTTGPCSCLPTAGSRCVVLHPLACQVLLKAHVARICFKCFRCFRDMLQGLYIDVTKVDWNIALL